MTLIALIILTSIVCRARIRAHRAEQARQAVLKLATGLDEGADLKKVAESIRQHAARLRELNMAEEAAELEKMAHTMEVGLHVHALQQHLCLCTRLCICIRLYQ